jgi:hypothetical protein
MVFCEGTHLENSEPCSVCKLPVERNESHQTRGAMENCAEVAHSWHRWRFFGDLSDFFSLILFFPFWRLF